MVTLGAATAAAERLAVTAAVANVRSGPGTKYAILWKVEKYHPIVTIEKSGPWYRFYDFEDDRGWLHESLVGRVQTVITRGDLSNVRSGPGTSHQIAFKVEKGIPFKVLKEEGHWIHVEHVDGDTGWLHDSLVW